MIPFSVLLISIRRLDTSPASVAPVWRRKSIFAAPPKPSTSSAAAEMRAVMASIFSLLEAAAALRSSSVLVRVMEDVVSSV